MKCHGGPDGFPVAVYVLLLRFFLLDDVTPCLICENVTAESEPQVSHKSISLWSNLIKSEPKRKILIDVAQREPQK